VVVSNNFSLYFLFGEDTFEWLLTELLNKGLARTTMTAIALQSVRNPHVTSWKSRHTYLEYHGRKHVGYLQERFGYP
jgi:hypothetical protein